MRCRFLVHTTFTLLTLEAHRLLCRFSRGEFCASWAVSVVPCPTLLRALQHASSRVTPDPGLLFLLPGLPSWPAGPLPRRFFHFAFEEAAVTRLCVLLLPLPGLMLFAA
jgi:hypothetical protein